MTGQDSGNLSDKLNKTKEKLNLLSKKVAETTKAMVESTNNSIKSTINEHKEKRQQKKDERVAQARSDISSDGLMNDIPAMITLPEFEQERMEIAVEQNDTMVTIVEEMQILSERVDSIERRLKNIKEIENNKVNKRTTNQHRTVNDELIMNQIVQFLGVSVIWIVLLIVGDYYSTENSIKINDEYPLRYLIWAFGTSSWIYFVLYKLGNSSPLLNLPMILKVQITLVVGIVTLIAMITYSGSTDAISNVWFWGSTIAVVLLLSASLITNVWQSTKRLISARDEVEIIE